MAVSRDCGIFLLICTIFISEGGAVVEVLGYQLFQQSNCFSNDIWQGAVNSEADCAQRCNSDPNCVAFVYYVYRASPPQYCYTKSVCDEASLYWSGDLYTYLRLDTTTQAGTTTLLPTTEVLTTTEETSTLPNTLKTNTASTTTQPQVSTERDTGSPTNSTMKTFTFVPYTVSDDSESPSEAPSATGIGVFMILLLLAFMIFLIVIDLDSYYRALKKGYRNLKQGLKRRCCKSKKSGASDNNSDSENEGKRDNDHDDDMDDADVESQLEKVKVIPDCQMQRESPVDDVKVKSQKEATLNDIFSKRTPSQDSHRRKNTKPLVKQLSKKSLVYHIEDVD